VNVDRVLDASLDYETPFAAVDEEVMEGNMAGAEICLTVLLADTPCPEGYPSEEAMGVQDGCKIRVNSDNTTVWVSRARHPHNRGEVNLRSQYSR
jgi:hypothetical protein